MKSKYCTIYLVRHGETEWNVKKLMQGQGDSKLTKKGIKQAHLLAKKLKKIHFDEAFSSDLLRAKHTAEIITLERKIAVKTTQMLRERSYGKFEGKPWTAFETHLQKLLNKYENVSDELLNNLEFEDSETINTCSLRVITFLRETAVAYSGKTILVVAHGGVMRYTLIKLGIGTHKTLPSGSISNLGYVKLESDGVDFFVKETEGIIIQS